jgi:hypothetical protein
MLHKLEVIVAAAQRDLELMPGSHLPHSEDPSTGMCRCDRSVLLPDRQTRGKIMSRARSTTSGIGVTLVHRW